MEATDKVTRVIAYMLADSIKQGKQITKVIQVEDLQDVLDKNNACLHYKNKFFDSVEEANLQPYYVSLDRCSIYDVGGGYYTDPRVTIVPKGTKVEYGMFVMPKQEGE
jgi:hypothetical protein